MKKSIFATLGVSAVSFALWLMLLNLMSDKSGLRAQATVVDCRIVEEADSSDANQLKKMYYPTLEFKDAGGRLHTKSFQKTTVPYVQGQALKIIYNPQRPSQISIDTFWSNWWVSILILILGGASFFYATQLD